MNTMDSTPRNTSRSFSTDALVAAIRHDAAHPARPGGRTIVELTMELLEATEPTC